MDTPIDFQKLFAYDEWANRQTLAVLKNMPEIDSARELISHILEAQRAWYDRIEGKYDPDMNLRPECSLSECENILEENSRLWDKFLENLTPRRLLQPISYLNSKRQAFQSAVQDILMHIIIHGAHHRAQISRIIRQNGGEPPKLDFIFYTRN